MPRLAQRRKDLVAHLMKDGIYDAAVAVMTRHGIDGLTMDRVALEAGVAKGSLYKYFPSKTELLHSVYERTLQPMQQMIQEVLDQELPAIETLRVIQRAWFEYLAEHRGLFNFLFNDYAVRHLFRHQEATARASARADVARIIQRGIAEGAFRPLDPVRAAWMLFGAAREMVEQQLATDGPWPIDELTDGLLDFFLRGVAAG